MKYTNNLNLKKPEPNDYFDQENHANYNMDVLDSRISLHLAEIQQLKDYLNYMPINGGSFDGNDPLGLTVDGGKY
jgi:hypothetical protein